MITLLLVTFYLVLTSGPAFKDGRDARRRARDYRATVLYLPPGDCRPPGWKPPKPAQIVWVDVGPVRVPFLVPPDE